MKKIAILFMIIGITTVAWGDSWSPPMQAEYFSTNNSYMLIVEPRTIDSSLEYFQDKVSGRSPAGQRSGGQRYCRGILAQKSKDGEYKTIWDQALINDVSPVSAIVADDGKYVVTFDNWHSKGFGKRVVVIYGPEGKLVRAFGLDDILPKDRVEKLPRSVSSIWWGMGHHFDSDSQLLVLRVASNSIMPYDDRAEFQEIMIELATGKVVRSKEGP